MNGAVVALSEASDGASTQGFQRWFQRWFHGPLRHLRSRSTTRRRNRSRSLGIRLGLGLRNFEVLKLQKVVKKVVKSTRQNMTKYATFACQCVNGMAWPCFWLSLDSRTSQKKKWPGLTLVFFTGHIFQRWCISKI